MGGISSYSTVVLMILAGTFSTLAVGQRFASGVQLTSSQLALFEDAAKNIALAETGLLSSASAENDGVRPTTFYRIMHPYLFVSVCFLIPPPTDGFVENKAIVLHLLNRLTPQSTYSYLNISTTRNSTPAVAYASCNGTVWDHDAYREKCTYCMNYLLADPDMVPSCNWTTGIAIGFDLVNFLKPKNLPEVNCSLSFTASSNNDD